MQIQHHVALFLVHLAGATNIHRFVRMMMGGWGSGVGVVTDEDDLGVRAAECGCDAPSEE